MAVLKLALKRRKRGRIRSERPPRYRPAHRAQVDLIAEDRQQLGRPGRAAARRAMRVTGLE